MTEEATDTSTSEASTSQPIPDAPSSISKLLNLLECDGDALIEALLVNYDLGDSAITSSIREQDELVKQVWALASGISQKLPRSYKMAMKGEEAELWDIACKKEIEMFESMGVWTEVALPAKKRAVTSKWVFARKLDSAGRIMKYKARFVVQGFDQREGIDFQETFAPTARFGSLMIMFAIAVKKKWIMQGFDVVSAYPHSPIDEEIYIEPPEGFPCKVQGHVLLLKKALYGKASSTLLVEVLFESTTRHGMRVLRKRSITLCSEIQE